MAWQPPLDGHETSLRAQQVVKFCGSIQVEPYPGAPCAERLWYLLHHEECVPALGALTGNQAVR